MILKDEGKLKVLDLMKNIVILNLTCTLVGREDLCRTENYTYESPLDPGLLIPMKKLEILHLGKRDLVKHL